MYSGGVFHVFHVNLLLVYFTASGRQKLTDGFISTVFPHKEQKEERGKVKDWIKGKQVALKSLYKVLIHTVEIRISSQVYFLLNRGSKEWVCENRAMK